MKRSDIISRFKHWYYYNADKHIGDMLYRMVKSGSLIKTRRGYYGIGDSSPRPLPTNKTNPNRVSDNPNQLSII